MDDKSRIKPSDAIDPRAPPRWMDGKDSYLDTYAILIGDLEREKNLQLEKMLSPTTDANG